MKNIIRCLVPIALLFAISCEDMDAAVEDTLSAEDTSVEDITAYSESWTDWFSEEGDGYQMCPEGTREHVVRGVACRGAYCDNMKLYCAHALNQPGGDQHWTGWFSDEAPSAKSCDMFGGEYWVTGIACKDAYCDSINLLCTAMREYPLNGQCALSGWYSEEQEAFMAPVGWGIKKVECKGTRCDKKRYWYCELNYLDL